MRWQHFLSNNDVQIEIREITFELLNYLNSPFAIYVPDNGYRESSILDFIWKEDGVERQDIHFIQNWLLNKCGPPKNYIKDIYMEIEDYWDSEGYYIDDFKDIKLNS
jgi:hypothetical protein